MDRRKTILIAVLVNAGLLVLLFIAFLYQEEEVPVRHDLVQIPQEEQRTPLFNDIALATPEPMASAPIAQQIAIEHPLPPIAAVEEPVAAGPPAPLAAVAAALEIQVKKGDTLEKIAKAHHTTVDEIIQFNRLPSSFLRVGQVLKLPPERAASNAAPKIAAAEKKAVNQEYYTVKVGDNPWTIAMKHHMKVEELLKLNNLNEEKARRLKVGDKLRIR
jgi:LysM repeat protein